MTRRVSILDLTVNQVESIERELGLPMARWGDAPSLAALYRLAYEAATGQPAGALTMRELAGAVSLDGETDPDPTQPAPPSA
jgi:hypothetical protein